MHFKYHRKAEEKLTAQLACHLHFSFLLLSSVFLLLHQCEKSESLYLSQHH